MDGLSEIEQIVKEKTVSNICKIHFHETNDTKWWLLRRDCYIKHHKENKTMSKL